MSKLVRDRIPEIMRIQNKNPDVRILYDDAEYLAALKQKLLEEVSEFLDAKNDEEAMNEVADILEVLDAISEFKTYNYKEIQDRKRDKKRERGGFKKRVLLIS